MVLRIATEFVYDDSGTVCGNRTDALDQNFRERLPIVHSPTFG